MTKDKIVENNYSKQFPCSQ